MYVYSGIKIFWPVLNNEPVRNSMKISNYTNITHDNLLKVLYGKIEFSFKGRANFFIVIIDMEQNGLRKQGVFLIFYKILSKKGCQMFTLELLLLTGE